MTENNTISFVVKHDLCTGCGTCVALCPEKAIKLTINENTGTYIPELNKEKCNTCGTCYKVCPGHEVNFKKLNLEIFGKEPEDVLIGNYLNCYIGYSTDYDVRYNSASGGIVTQLLIFALEEGIIDGALVTRMKKGNPLEPEPFIARTKEEIIEASKSKYCPVPANIALKEILESKEGQKFAVVGLPCHILGIRKAEQINKKLKEKIVLHFGIFCSHTPNFIGTELLLRMISIRKKDVIKINYRGEGWPGKMLIKLKNGSKKFVPPPNWMTIAFGSFFFIPTRCQLCYEGICKLADISFGDAWLPELRDDKLGTSIIICRTEMSKKLLESAKTKRKIELVRINNKKVVQSQKGMISFKNGLKARIFFFKLFGKHVPNYNSELLKPNLRDYLDAILIYLRTCISAKPYLRGLLCAYFLFKEFLFRCASYYYHIFKNVVNK